MGDAVPIHACQGRSSAENLYEFLGKDRRERAGELGPNFCRLWDFIGRVATQAKGGDSRCGQALTILLMSDSDVPVSPKPAAIETGKRKLLLTDSQPKPMKKGQPSRDITLVTGQSLDPAQSSSRLDCAGELGPNLF